MSKRILSLVLTLALILGSFSMAFADTATTTSSKTMTDVEGTQYEKAVLTLGKLKVLEGYTDGTFKPGNTITRAEFAAVASRIRGLEAAAQNSKGTTEFKDVPASHWASGYVNVASKNGLIKGMGNGQFAPEAPITYEQAITMIVRALGYEYAAQSLGGYPVGYLSVASQEQLLKGINEGAQGTPASRGLVALLLNNALDIPKMIQVGYGDQAKWIQSGTENTDKKFLFEDLGLKQIDKVVVTKADSKKQQVTIGGKGLKADKDFDYVGLLGMRVTAWYDSKTDELIVAKEDGAYKAKYDVVEKTTKSDEIKLIGANEKYDVAKNSGVKASDYTADNNTYAKVIIDEYGEVRQIISYNLTDKIVVKEVSKDLIKGYDRKEISDSKDYTIIKNGKEISASDLKDKDFLIYDSKEEVAVVITDIRTGKIDTVYKEGFKFEGKTYDFKTDRYKEVKYVSNDNLENVDDSVLEEMQKNGEVKVYFSFDGKPLFIDGKAEEVASNYVMLTSDTKEWDNRGTKNRTFDVLNSEGKTVEYSVKVEDITKDDKLFNGTLANWDSSFKSETVAKITTDASNKLTKVELVSGSKVIDSNNNLETNDTYFRGSRLQSNAVVFMKDGESKVKDYSVIKWADATKEFKKVIKGNAYTDNKDNVVAIFAEETDGDTQTKDVVGVLKKSKETTAKSRYDVIIEINGKEVDYQAKGTVSNIANLEKEINEVVVLKVTKEGNELRKWSLPAATDVETVTVKSATSGTLTDTNDKNYDIEGEYYNNSLKSKIKAGDVKDKEVTLYFQPGSTRYVQVVQLGTGGITTTGVVTYINAAKTAFEVDNKTFYTITAQTVLKDGTTTTNMGMAVGASLVVGDQIKVEGDVITRTAKAADRSAAVVVDNQIAALTFVDPANPTAGEITAVQSARLAYGSLTPAQKDLVTKLSVLEAKEAIIAGSPTAAVDAVKTAATSGSKTQFITALKNSAFAASYKVANDDAYWAAKSSFNSVATVANVITALDNVNTAEAEKAAVKAVTVAVSENDKVKLASALANTVFTQSKVVAANMNAYLAHASFTGLTVSSTVANVHTALDTVNAEELVKADATAVGAATYAAQSVAWTTDDATTKALVVGKVVDLVNAKTTTVTVVAGNVTWNTAPTLTAAGLAAADYTFDIVITDGTTSITKTITVNVTVTP